MKEQKIVPCLWFDGQAEEAVNFYSSVFRKSEIISKAYYPEAGTEVHHQKPGSVLTVDFKLDNFQMLALNAGPDFKFNPSISLFITLQDEDEISRLWSELSKGGNVMMPLDKYDWSPQYGWTEDRFGISWQLMLEEKPSGTPRLLPLLFFTGSVQGKAEEAINYYTSVFKESGIVNLQKYGPENKFAEGDVIHAQFRLEGQGFMAMDSGMENNFPFNEAFSLMVRCKDQEEIDYYWDKLGKGGDKIYQQCGWLKDKFGVSWQVTPENMGSFFTLDDREKVNRCMEAMLQMKKIDVNKLESIARA